MNLITCPVCHGHGETATGRFENGNPLTTGCTNCAGRGEVTDEAPAEDPDDALLDNLIALYGVEKAHAMMSTTPPL